MKYWRLPDSLIRLLNLTTAIRGRCGRYLFQMSNGGQQVKLYDKRIYRNEVNTPLRIRTRTIMRMALAEPEPTLQEKLNLLYRTYPYHLLKNRPEKIRVTNFYFQKPLSPGQMLNIYKMSGPEPDPDNDTLLKQLAYDPKKSIRIEFTGIEEELFYAHSPAKNEFSNTLRVIWE